MGLTSEEEDYEESWKSTPYYRLRNEKSKFSEDEDATYLDAIVANIAELMTFMKKF